MRKIIMSLATVLLLLFASGVAVGTSDEADDRGVIIGFEERFDRTGRERLVKEIGGTVSHSYTLINAAAAHIPPEAIDGLRRNPHVTYIEEDYTVKATEQQLPWGIDRIGAPIVHGYNKGTGIKVAILDTGLDHDHPDLSANYKGGIDYANDDNDPMDDNGHGTHCAGIAGAVDNDIGVIGVAPEASLYGVKVMDSGGSGSISDIIAGIEWSVNNSMQIISMSFGGDYPSEALQDACNAAYNNGVLLVAAAGNDGNWAGVGNSVDYPARYDSVIAVAATDSNNARAPWSSTGPAVELAAPGVSVYSTCWDDTYTTKQGTSMACPHVSGTAALILATPEDTARDADNDGTYETDGDGVWTNNEVRAILQATADDLGDPGRDNLYGFGLVNASKAAPPSGDDTTGPMTSGMSADPNPTNGADSVTLTASISDSTTGNSDIAAAEYFVNAVGADGTGTSMNPSDGAFDSATEDVTADISGWAVGSYTLHVHGNDSAGNWGATEQVILEVTTEDTTGPMTSGMSADPNPTNGADVTLTASISDSTTGNSDIAAAEYFVNAVGADGTGTSMNPSDGAFDSATEDVTADISGWAVGSYTLHVHGNDSAGNWGATGQVTLEVTEASTNTMHVDSIDMNLNSAYGGQLYYATARVTIVDATGSPVVGATVSGHWEGATNDQDSGLTGQTGQTPNLRSDIRWQRSTPSGTTFTFVVDVVTKDEWTYNPDANEETEDDVTVP